MDYKSVFLNNYLKNNEKNKDINILSIQKSKSTDYYAGTINEPVMEDGFRPTRREGSGFVSRDAATDYSEDDQHENEDEYFDIYNQYPFDSHRQNKKSKLTQSQDYSQEEGDEEEDNFEDLPKNHKS